MTQTALTIDGLVARPIQLSWEDLSALPEVAQVRDLTRLDSKRKGDAVRLSALLERAGVAADAAYLTIHSSSDDFHASIPLSAVRESALVVYRLDGQPLPAKSGGPLRFFIPDHAACHTAEIDECANVKFVDRLELSAQRGYDNRPQEETQHAALHARQQGEAH